MKNTKIFVSVLVLALFLFTSSAIGASALTTVSLDANTSVSTGASAGGASGSGSAGPSGSGIKKPTSLQVQSSADVTLNARARADLEATYKRDRVQCDRILNSDEKKACRERIEATYKAAKNRLEDSNSSRDDRPGKVEDRDDRLMKYEEKVEKTLKRLSATLERLTKISDRIAERLKKLNADKIDTSVSERYLKAAREDLAKAKATIASAYEAWRAERASARVSVLVSSRNAFEKCKANGGIILKTFPAQCKIGNETYVDSEVNVNSGTNSDKASKENFLRTRALIKTAKEELKSAHANLVNSIKNMKPGRNKIDGNASSTANVNTTTVTP